MESITGCISSKWLYLMTKAGSTEYPAIATRKIEGGIPLVERLAVVIIPDESDAGSPFCQHIIDKFRSFCNVIHI